MSPQTQTRQRTGTRAKAASKARAKRGRPAGTTQAKRGRPAAKAQAKRGRPAAKAQAKRGRQSSWQRAGEQFGWVTDGAYAVLQALGAAGGGEISRDRLAGMLGINADAAGKQLGELRRHGVLSERAEGRNRIYGLNNEGRRLCNLAACIQQHWQEESTQESTQQPTYQHGSTTAQP